MSIEVLDRVYLDAISVTQIKEYLKSHAWLQRGSNQLGVTYWTYNKGDGPKYSALIPPDKDFEDFFVRVREVLNALSEIEHRSPLSIYQDIVAAGSDILRVRSAHPLADDGSIPLVDGVKLFQGVYSLLVAAAAVVDSKRPSLPNRKPAEVMQYVNQTRIGQTERGSYTLVLHSSLHSDVTRNSILQEIPLGRRVLETLVSALGSLQVMSTSINVSTAGEQDIEEWIGDFVRSGGSVDLCQAIEALSDSAQEEPIEISISWSREVPIDQQYEQTVVINRHVTELSVRVGKIIRRQLVEEEKLVIGRVIRLVRGTGNYVASTTIEGEVDGRQRRIRLHIRSDEDHQLVIKAYQSRRPISCKGRLVKRGNFTLVENYYHLRIVEAHR